MFLMESWRFPPILFSHFIYSMMKVADSCYVFARKSLFIYIYIYLSCLTGPTFILRRKAAISLYVTHLRPLSPTLHCTSVVSTYPQSCIHQWLLLSSIPCFIAIYLLLVSSYNLNLFKARSISSQAPPAIQYQYDHITKYTCMEVCVLPS